MTFFRALRNANRSHWNDAAIWLVYTLIGSLTPVWFGWFLLTLLTRNPSWADFSHHGEFALYSAAMFAPTLYIVLRDVRSPGFPGRLTLGLLTFVGTLVATGFFAAVTTAFLAPPPVLLIDKTFLSRGTFILFTLSALLAFIVTVLDNARLIPDVRQITNAQQAELSKEFDELGGKR